MPSPEPRVDDEISADQLRAIVQDAHLNFLVGAGTPSAYFAQLGGIEDALTALSQSPAGDSRELARASIQAVFFDKVVAPNVQLLELHDAARPLVRSYADFGRTLNRLLIKRRNSLLSKKVNLFTTNIDLAFEVAFERLSIDLIDGFVGRLRPVYDLGTFGSLHYRTGVRYEHRSEAPTFDLYKLHGSVGWQLTDDPAAPSGIALDARLSDTRKISDALAALRADLIAIPDLAAINVDALLDLGAGREVPAGLTAFQEAYSRLAIVNPEKEKFATTVLTEVYYELIRRFANELERENCVLFVHGFSFRDEHLRKLVLRSARANPTLQVIVFCYSLTDREAYRELIPDEQLPNSNFSYVVPGKDEHLNLDEVVRRFFAPLSGEPSRESDEQFESALSGAGEDADLD